MYKNVYYHNHIQFSSNTYTLSYSSLSTFPIPLLEAFHITFSYVAFHFTQPLAIIMVQ